MFLDYQYRFSVHYILNVLKCVRVGVAILPAKTYRQDLAHGAVLQARTSDESAAL